MGVYTYNKYTHKYTHTHTPPSLFLFSLPPPPCCVVDGYVRTEAVGIDYDLIKEQKKGPLPNQPEEKPEVYDDVGILDNACR